MDKTVLKSRKSSRKNSRGLAKAIATCALVGAVAVIVLGCAGNSADAGPIAISGDGVSVPENDVTVQLTALKKQVEADGKTTWEQYLAEVNLTSEAMRESYAWQLADTQLVINHAGEIGVSIDDAEVQAQLEATKAGFVSENAYKMFLEENGFTEETFKQNIEKTILDQKIAEHFGSETAVDAAQLEEVTKSFLESYAGEVKFERIRFVETTPSGEAVAGNPADIAKQALEMIERGDVTFEGAYEAYAAQGATEIVPGGEWSMYAGIDGEEAEAIKKLSVGEVASFERDGYADVVRVTDKVPAPSQDTGFDSLSADVQGQIMEIARSNAAWSKYAEWLQNLRTASHARLAPAPSDLPY